MVERRRRKKNKLRGQRTMGAGNTKNRRGAGSRGGRGKAGANKHRFDTFNRFKGKKYRLKGTAKGKAITLGQLDLIIERLLAKGKVVQEGDKIIIDKRSGYEKILSQGETKRKIVLKINASKKAIAKIIKAGGKFEFAKKNYSPEEISFDEDDEDLEFEEAEESEAGESK